MIKIGKIFERLSYKLVINLASLLVTRWHCLFAECLFFFFKEMVVNEITAS